MAELRETIYRTPEGVMLAKPIVKVNGKVRDLNDLKVETGCLPDPFGDDDEQPVANDPLRGLRHLGPLAAVGRDRLLALAAEPVSYVWQDIAVRATVILIAGAPAEGKTTLLFLVLAARMTLGNPVYLLARKIEPAPQDKWIVVIEGEHSEGSAVRKLLKSMHLLEVNDLALDRLVMVARKAVRLGSPAWGDVERMVAAGIVSDIAIDTVARVAPADSNSEAEQVAIFDAVARTIERAPVESQPTVWAVAHTRKNGTSGELSDVAGSAQRTGQADSVLLLKGEKVDGRTVSTKVTFAKLREEPDEYPLPVTFSIGSDDGKPTITALVARDDDQRPLETRILEQLSTGPKTKRALRNSLGVGSKVIEEAISTLFAGQAISTTTVTITGREYKAFMTRDNALRSVVQSAVRGVKNERGTSVVRRGSVFVSPSIQGVLRGT